MNLGIGLGVTNYLRVPTVPLDPEQVIADLFDAGGGTFHEGAWYDPSDLSTMYQDSAGTTPVTASGQPVGLLLDKSKGGLSATELVSNGTFDTDLSGWGYDSLGLADASNYWEWSSGKARVVSDGTFVNLYQTGIFTAGKTYQITFDVVASAGLIKLGTVPSANNIAGLSLIGTGSHSVIFTATSNALYIGRQAGTVDATIDNISVRELPGNHATQSTSAARPVLQTSGGLWYLDFDGVDDGMTTAAVDFSVTENATLFAAVNKETEPANQAIVELSISTNNQGMFTLTGKSGLAKYGVGSRGTALGFATTSDAAFAAPSKNVVTGLVSITGNLAELRLDGASVAVDNTDQGDRAYLNSSLNIMARNNASSNWLDGHLYGLIIRGASSTTAEIAATESYLAAKSGVTLP